MGSLGGIPGAIVAVCIGLVLALFVVSLVIAGPTYVFATGAATLTGWTMPDFETFLLVIMGAIFVFFMFAISS